MMLCLRNCQRDCPIDLRLLRRILRFALEHSFSISDYELCFHFVAAPEMAGVNEKFLDHVGPTDVITFNYERGRTWQTGSLRYSRVETCATASRGADGERLHGDILICPEVAACTRASSARRGRRKSCATASMACCTCAATTMFGR